MRKARVSSGPERVRLKGRIRAIVEELAAAGLEPTEYRLRERLPGYRPLLLTTLRDELAGEGRIAWQPGQEGPIEDAGDDHALPDLTEEERAEIEAEYVKVQAEKMRADEREFLVAVRVPRVFRDPLRQGRRRA